MGEMSMNNNKNNAEKYFKAERRNKLERSRLELTRRYYDREAFRTKFSINREKRVIVKHMEYMQRCSGASNDGLAPDDPHDNDYAKSTVYANGFRISNERMTKWRKDEKNIVKMLRPDGLGYFGKRGYGVSETSDSGFVTKEINENSEDSIEDDFSEDDIEHSKFLRFIELMKVCKRSAGHDQGKRSWVDGKTENDVIMDGIKNIKIDENDTVLSLSRKNSAIKPTKKISTTGVKDVKTRNSHGEMRKTNSTKSRETLPPKTVSTRPHTSVNLSKRDVCKQKSAKSTRLERPETAPGEYYDAEKQFVVAKNCVYMKCNAGYKKLKIPEIKKDENGEMCHYDGFKDTKTRSNPPLLRQASDLFKRTSENNSGSTEEAAVACLDRTEERPSSRQERRSSVKYSNDVSSFRTVAEVLRAARSFSKLRRKEILKKMVNDNAES